ncbi:hypothetical protein AeRB84_008823 [Aphanomyces euteiches]|nr:hypothetical protein AeRB84_008823 [Aphanomyces euteiches]
MLDPHREGVMEDIQSLLEAKDSIETASSSLAATVLKLSHLAGRISEKLRVSLDRVQTVQQHNVSLLASLSATQAKIASQHKQLMEAESDIRPSRLEAQAVRMMVSVTRYATRGSKHAEEVEHIPDITSLR